MSSKIILTEELATTLLNKLEGVMVQGPECDLKSTQAKLEKRLESAMDYLEIPSHHDEESGWIPKINKENLWGTIKNPGSESNAEQISQLMHEMRVGLYSVLLMDYLGIKNKGWRHQMFTAYLCHDAGKDFVMGPGDGFPINTLKPEDFGKEQAEAMNMHVNPELFCFDYGPVVDVIVEGHHHYRKNKPYPEKLTLEETPETKLLTQNLLALDIFDAASTRKNERTNYRLLEKSEVKKLLIEEFGEQKLIYNGYAFPKMEKTGKEFVEELYSAKILGRENPFDPFRSADFNKFLKWMTPKRR